MMIFRKYIVNTEDKRKKEFVKDPEMLKKPQK